MKKSLLSLLLLFAATSWMFAQTVVFSDNFDSYTAGSHLAQSSSAWTTWSNAPGTAEDGVISTAQAASAPNSLYISGSNDQVYPFGNYTTGHYTLTFNYYVPSSGNGAYFNIQHILLQQWALECYFNNNGTGYLSVGGLQNNFNYPSNAWFPIEFDVDMDNDQASLTVNNVLVHSWPFSYQEGNTNGVNQLAGINFYAGSPTSGVPGTYYVDDFVVTEVSAALVGQFAVTPENLLFEMSPNTTSTQAVTLSNPGTGGTDFYTLVTYDIPNPDPTPTTVTDLHYYQAEPYTSVGFTSGATEVDIAIGYPSSALQQYIGKTLNEVYVFFGSAISTAKLRVYAMGNQLLHPGPGEVVYEQTFSVDSGWNNVQLTTPYVIDGSDLWFGVWFTQPDGAYEIHLDGAFANDYSCWYKTGSTWHNRFVNTDFDFNLCLGGKIGGTPITPWLSATPSDGSLNAGATLNVNVTANSAGMSGDDNYSATLHCFSSDIENDDVEVAITLTITEVSVNEYNQIEVSVYPNPATDYVQVTSDQIERVEVYNMMGQLVFDQLCGDSHLVIPTNGFAPGTYAVKVTTTNGTMTKQVVVK